MQQVGISFLVPLDVRIALRQKLIARGSNLQAYFAGVVRRELEAEDPREDATRSKAQAWALQGSLDVID